MADITEIAVAAWRLEKWLDNINVERKMAAKSALRSIKKYLQENEVEIVDLTGAKFDVGLAVSVVNNESDETDEDKLIISEMVKPIIKEKGAVIQYGQVILGDEVKKPKANNVVKEETKSEAVEKVVSIATEIETSNDDNTPKNPSEEKDDSNPVETTSTDNKKKSRTWAWIAIMAMQIIVIFLLVNVINEVNSVKQNAMVGTSVAAVSSENDKEEDAYDIESGIENLNDRMDTFDTKSEEMTSEIDVIESKLDEISAGMEQNQEKATEASNEVENKETSEASNEVESKEPTEESYLTYIVQSGDTLIGICEKNGIDYYAHKEEIIKLNGITDPGIINVGQELKLPKE